jgi:hypothetical protein
MSLSLERAGVCAPLEQRRRANRRAQPERKKSGAKFVSRRHALRGATSTGGPSGRGAAINW